MAAALAELGVTTDDVLQGEGGGPASAGSHLPESRTAGGHLFSSCVDIPDSLLDQGLFDRMVDAGFCLFERIPGQGGWPASDALHAHSVYVGARNDAGNVTILPGPRMQIIDWIAGRNGLVGHAPIRTYSPSADQRATIHAKYAAWAPSYATKVLAPDGNAIPCYAFLEIDAVRCEARPFLEYWGATIKAGTWGATLAAEYKGAQLDLTAAHPAMAGDFTRADVRGLAEALRLGISFDWSADKSSAVVKLAYE